MKKETKLSAGVLIVACVLLVLIVIAKVIDDQIEAFNEKREKEINKKEFLLSFAFDVSPKDTLVTLAGDYRYLPKTIVNDSVSVAGTSYQVNKMGVFGENIILRNTRDFIEVSLFRDSLTFKKHSSDE